MTPQQRRRYPQHAARFVLLFMALALADPAQAFRCGNRIVSAGDHSSRVLNICGEPTSIQQRVIWRSGPTAPRLRPHGRAAGDHPDREVLIWSRSLVEVNIEEWLYDLGPRRLMRLVRFENGVVTEIRNLGYGNPD